MTGDHSHVSAGARHKRPLAIALGLTATYMLVEVFAGIVFNSLALLSDAGHMLTDVAGLGMALAAIQAAESSRNPSHTYGLYRAAAAWPEREPERARRLPRGGGPGARCAAG